MLNRFVDGAYNPDISTTLGVEYRKKTVEIQEIPVDIQIWDTAGQERFRTITPNYYKNVQGVILVYDITCAKSFEQVDYWMQNIKDHGNAAIVQCLVGQKVDVQDKRAVSKEQGTHFALTNNMHVRLLYQICFKKQDFLNKTILI